MSYPENDDREASVEQAGSRVHIQSVAVTAYAGPLPHPEVLARYEDTYPGAAKIVFDDFISESAHRRQSERRALQSAIFRMNLGVVVAAILGTLVLAEVCG